MSQEQHLKPGTLPASRPDVLARPKAYTDLIAALDVHGFVYYVRWNLWDDGSVTVSVIALAPWDHAVRIEAAWASPDGKAPLKRTKWTIGRPFHPQADASLKAALELIAARPEPRAELRGGL